MTDQLFPTAQPPTMSDQIACVRREIAMRRNVYPVWVKSGRLKEAEADRELERMQAVHDSLERLSRMDSDAATAAQIREPVAEFVLGYALSAVGMVMMIQKTADMPSGEGLNGIGGRIMTGETPEAAMIREWEEETGRHAPAGPDRFRCMGDFGGRGFRVHVFATPAMSEWPALHGRHEPEHGVITAMLSSMLARNPAARYSTGMPTAMALCPWVPTTLAMAFLEHTPPAGREPRLLIRS